MHAGADLSRNICHDVIAQGMGCHGERVEKIEQLAPALERAVVSGRQALLHVVVDLAVNADPPGFKEFRRIRML